MSHTDYFKQLAELLKIEKEEDLKSYLKLTSSSTVAERRARGLAWYPIAIRGSEMSRGDYITVELERTTYHDVSHQLRFGMPAALFSNHQPEKDRVEGVISYQGGNRLKLTLKTDDLPEWASDGKLGIDLLFDSNSYEEMNKALRQAAAVNEDSASFPLVQVLTGARKATVATGTEPIRFPNLNESQQEAVNTILTANELAIVHGPPGTGKTTTLVQAIKALIKQNKQQILVVAPSNTAVDLLSTKLSAEGLSVLRVGNPARVSETLMSLTLDHQLAAHPDMKEIKSLKKRANEYKTMAHKYKRNFGRAEKEQRKALFDEAFKIMKEVDKAEQYLSAQLISNSQVIAATLIGANHYTVRDRKYHTVIIDEAGQALEPACWIPILKASKVVFAGDHCQLPPTVKSAVAERKGLSYTLFEKCIHEQTHTVALLKEQYRMNEEIMGYSSAVFYDHLLQANASVATHKLFESDQPLLFIDTAGCGYDEQLQGTSSTNPEEAVFLLKHLEQLTQAVRTHQQHEAFPSIAIISPYKQQVQVIKEYFDAHPALQAYKDDVSINTIDSFQGQERDIVYISLTRSNAEGAIGFLADIRRMNVAMTRARKKLVVIGDSATLSKSKFYADFISYAEQLGAYQSAWEYIET